MNVWQPGAGELGKEDPVKVCEILNRLSIRPSAMASGIVLTNPSTYEECVARWKQHIQLARSINAPIMFTRSFPVPDGVTEEDAWTNCIKLCRDFTLMCADAGLIFAFETDHGRNLVRTLADTLRLLEEVNLEAMKINYDPANFYVGGNSPQEVLDALYDRVVHGHIKDAVCPEGEPAREVQVGQGDLDYVEILSDLEKRNYQGAMVIEHRKTFEDLNTAWQHIQQARVQAGV